jgi:hypothetical protein
VAIEFESGSSNEEECAVITICAIVQQALRTGYLSVADEDQLRELLRTERDADELNAFMQLQAAAMTGQVKQESWELFAQRPS